MSDLSFSSFCNWLKFRHLTLLDTLGRTRNMHLAAQQMNLSQPALSKMPVSYTHLTLPTTPYV